MGKATCFLRTELNTLVNFWMEKFMVTVLFMKMMSKRPKEDGLMEYYKKENKQMKKRSLVLNLQILIHVEFPSLLIKIVKLKLFQ